MMSEVAGGQAVAEADAGGAGLRSPGALGPPGAPGAPGMPVRTRRRARVLGALSIVLGAAGFAVVPVPLPSAFPWLTLALSVAGIVAAVQALRARPRGRLAAGLAVAGLLVSLAFPALVVFVFVRYFIWNG
jgi:hypothetical protein